MFSHVSIGVKDLKRSMAFYDAVLKTLGHRRLFGDEAHGFMAYGDPKAYFVVGLPLDETKVAQACPGSHFCFSASSRQAVENFYKVALQSGGTSDGAPGFRKHYADDYFTCFVYDPDGHKIEAMARVVDEA